MHDTRPRPPPSLPAEGTAEFIAADYSFAELCLALFLGPETKGKEMVPELVLA